MDQSCLVSCELGAVLEHLPGEHTERLFTVGKDPELLVSGHHSPVLPVQLAAANLLDVLCCGSPWPWG